ncbi:MAG: hypothetical protein ACKVOU_08135 [Cytophagales bacterium]
MREKKLKEYLEDKLSADQLSLDLKDSQKRTGYDVTTVYIDSLKDGEFEIKKEHLIKLCDDTISNNLSPTDLNTIGFALMTSDHFYWDSDSPDGEIVGNVILEFDNPEIGYDITIKNVLLWKDYLRTGEYRLDKNELKQKFQSKGKYKELYQDIDEILWNDWDPIGINDTAPRDEYQSYTPTIFTLKNKGADQEVIAQKLFELETKNMGLDGNIKHCRQVAEKIVMLR